MNGKLRTDNPDGKFDTLLMPTGSVSQYFPNDLRSLLNLDGNHFRYGFSSFTAEILTHWQWNLARALPQTTSFLRSRTVEKPT